jgi:hypothetical protein
MEEEMIIKFWDWVDSRAVVRRIVLGYTLWMTWVGTAAIIAAILSPIAALQGFAFANYTKGRTE